MSLEQLFYLAQIVGSVAVIVSLVFVGLQIKENTAALQRNEHNSTMAQQVQISGLPERTLYRKLRALGLRRDE